MVLVALQVALVGMFSAGFWLGYRIARMFDRPPIGWVLVDIAFGVGLLRMLYLLYVVTYYSPVEDLSLWYGNAGLNLMTGFFFLPGVYFMYRDFKRKLREKQANLLVS